MLPGSVHDAYQGFSNSELGSAGVSLQEKALPASSILISVGSVFTCKEILLKSERGKFWAGGLRQCSTVKEVTIFYSKVYTSFIEGVLGHILNKAA